jgi:hypothetical protein
MKSSGHRVLSYVGRRRRNYPTKQATLMEQLAELAHINPERHTFHQKPGKHRERTI